MHVVCMNIFNGPHDICNFFQLTAAANLGVNDLNPNSLAGREVSVAGWGQTSDISESEESKLVSNIRFILLHRLGVIKRLHP